MSLRHLLSPQGLAVAATAATAAVWLPAPGQAQVLYDLATFCSLNGAAPVACTVQAVNQGKVTDYRHRIGQQTLTIRISDSPVRMQRYEAASNSWKSLSWASARFSSNTVCFDGRDLCVVNPNYLNSVQQQSSAAMAGRDLVKVHFGGDGRIDATCYDNGCEVNLK